MGQIGKMFRNVFEPVFAMNTKFGNQDFFEQQKSYLHIPKWIVQRCLREQ